MRHEPRDPAIAIEEGMDPQQPVMGRRRTENRIRLAEAGECVFEMGEEARHCARADRNVLTDLGVVLAQRAGYHFEPFASVGIFGPQQSVRQQRAKAQVDLLDAGHGNRPARQAAAVDPLLDGNMGGGLQLQVALARIIAVVFLQRAFDIDGMGVMPFDQVAVVAIHGAHEIGQRAAYAVGQAAPEASGACCKIDRQVGELAALFRATADQQRFDQRHRLVPIRRLDVLLNVRTVLCHKAKYNIGLQSNTGEKRPLVWPQLCPE